MKLIQKILTTLISVFSFSAQAGSWPPLPKTGFIVGLAATQANVAVRNAAFVAHVGCNKRNALRHKHCAYQNVSASTN